MNTLTTVACILPAAPRIGRAFELRAPMARVFFGGLVVSTVLTLLDIPAAYRLLHGRGSSGTLS